jgi:gamma-glutamyltranspeptidase/glutathione hydrolase
VGRAVAAWVADRGGIVTDADLGAYAAVPRTPIRSAYRGRTVLTNPPPNAGGILVAAALRALDDGPVSPARLVDVMEAVQAGRTPEFVAGLDEPGYADRFLARRLGSTTHISVLDGEGRAAAVTCTNGEGCGLVIPGTGMHPNNIMGEEDLNPLGLHRFPPGRRMPSMMAPSVMLDAGGDVELALGSAGSNRIRSALVQVIVGVVDHGLQVAEAVQAPRLHFEDGVVYAEPGIDLDAFRSAGRAVAPFRELNLFFGGVAAVRRDPDSGALGGAGDPRRGGAAVRA